MIISIKQIKSNLEIRFEIYHNNKLSNIGYCSRLTSFFAVKICTAEGNVIFKTKFDPVSEIISMIPLKWLWSKEKSNVTNILDLNEKNIGMISRIQEGLFNSYHTIQWFSNELKIYDICLGENTYYSIYLNELQIGMIIKNSYIINNLDQYKLFLLDHFSNYANILSLFVMYVDNFYHADRTEIAVAKIEKSYEWSYSKTDKYFDSLWLKKNFGLQEIDYKNIRKKGIILMTVFSLVFIISILLFYK